ncbi:hypothetical protein LCGC14_2733660 [marine sediment metagenome]|uniref:Uncharacterized protein n=1 Tax=marine sediment metagenome TaxID=412755 RepID=A0A0F9BFI7_9ZZZZ
MKRRCRSRTASPAWTTGVSPGVTSDAFGIRLPKALEHGLHIRGQGDRILVFACGHHVLGLRVDVLVKPREVLCFLREDVNIWESARALPPQQFGRGRERSS